MSFAGSHSRVRLRDTSGAAAVSPLGKSFKRAFDVAIALSGLLLLSPLLMITTLLVLVTMGMPVLYRDPRVGAGGRAVGCLKFRTTGKPGASAQTTFAGALLVESRLADLPQLINVLWGEMSCVGPRPLSAEELSRQGADVAAYLGVRPGLTGAWRLGPRRGVEARRLTPSTSILGDIAILLKRVWAPVHGEEGK